MDLKTLGYKMTGTVTAKYNADGKVLTNEYDVTDAYHRATKTAVTDGTMHLNVGNDGKPATYAYEETDAKVYGDTGALTKNQLTYRQEASMDTKVSTSDRAGFSVAQVSAKGVRVGQITGNRYDWASGKGHAEGVWAGTFNRLNNSTSVDTTTSDNGSSTSVALYSVRSTATDGSRQSRTIASGLGSGRYADNTTVNGTLNADGKQVVGDSFDHSESGGLQGGFNWTQRSGPANPTVTTLVTFTDNSSGDVTAELSYRTDGTADGTVKSTAKGWGDDDVGTDTLGVLKQGDGTVAYNDSDHRHIKYNKVVTADLSLSGGVPSGSVMDQSDRKVTNDYKIDRKIDRAKDILHATDIEDGKGSVETKDGITTTFADGKASASRKFVFTQTGDGSLHRWADGKLVDAAGHTGDWTFREDAAPSKNTVNNLLTVNSTLNDSGKWVETGRTFSIAERRELYNHFHQRDDGLGMAADRSGSIPKRTHTLDVINELHHSLHKDGSPDLYKFSIHNWDRSKREDFSSIEYARIITGDSGSYRDTRSTDNFVGNNQDGTDTKGEIDVTRLDTMKRDYYDHNVTSTHETPTFKDTNHLENFDHLTVTVKGTSKQGVIDRWTAKENRRWWESLDKTAIWTSGLTSGGSPDPTPGRFKHVTDYYGGQVTSTPTNVILNIPAELWQDFWRDPLGRWVSKHGGDVLRIGGGIFDVVIGFGLTDTGLGAIGGIPLMAIGIDQIYVGVNGLCNNPTPSVFEYAGYTTAQALGASESTSQKVGAFTPAILSLAFSGLGAWGSGFTGARLASATRASLFNTGPRGTELASEELLAAVGNKGRTITFAQAGSEEARYLNFMRANANVGGSELRSILLRPNATKIEVLEEFLHGTQHRLGIIDRLGMAGAEVHVKEFMIGHQRLLGLSPEDVKILQQLLGR